MTELYDTRRYLTKFDTRRMPNLFTDVLVIGSGVAGLRAGIEAAQDAGTLLVTKGRIEESSTTWAQGGVAVVTAPQDSYEQHVEDTLRVGCGLCDRAAVERTVREGPERIEELRHWGAIFDRKGDELLLGLEGGHSAPRIIHALGDSTGREISNTLIRTARDTDQLRVFEECFVVDLVEIDGRCVGATTYHRHFGHQMFWAKRTILATGGCGQIYRETTNPHVATGDGHAMAFRAGVPLRDMEMVQFHPTTLYIAGASRALISEAVRGEGAQLVDRSGRRFMEDYHADMELAPRDVVSRAILAEMAKQEAAHVYLDVRHLNVEKFRKRFPMINRLCEEFDIDVSREPIPVRPAAHYMIGGLVVDEDTRTPMSGLLACGEAASTGVHGANRLASNSLLEGLVFGAVAGRLAAEESHSEKDPVPSLHLQYDFERTTRTTLDLTDVRNSLRSIMWRNVGIERQGQRLAETIDIIEFWGRYVMDKLFDDQRGWETQNLLSVARLIAMAAAERAESRGVHYRSDHQATDHGMDGRHLALTRAPERVQVETV